MWYFSIKMKRTWSEIKLYYPNEHVVIIDPLCSPDDPTHLESGEVLDHDAQLDVLLSRCDLFEYDAYIIRYTGNLGEAIGARGMMRVVEHG